MHKLRALIASFFLCWCALAEGQTPPGWTADVPGGARFDLNIGRWVATNGVTIRYENAVLTARKAAINYDTGDVSAEGNVRIEREGKIWVGDKIEYNFKTGAARGGEFKTALSPFFAKGDVLVGDQKNEVYVVGNGSVTTDDYAEPGYSVHASSLVLVPGEYLEARNAVLYLGSVPVFYYPYYRKSLKRHPNNWVLVPGYRSRFGPYLLTSYNWYWTERLESSVHIDGYAQRGVGVGPDFTYHLPTLGEGTFKYYYIHDSKPDFDNLGLPVDSDRQRVWFQHETTIATNLTAKVVARWQSDALVVRDFFEGEYRKNSQPNSFFEVNKAWPNFSLDLYTQPRLRNLVLFGGEASGRNSR